MWSIQLLIGELARWDSAVLLATKDLDDLHPCKFGIAFPSHLVVRDTMMHRDGDGSFIASFRDETTSHSRHRPRGE